MNMINLVLPLILLIKVVKTQGDPCKANKNCFDCVSDSDKCKWNGGCLRTTEHYDKNKWYLKFEQCENDQVSIELMNKFCYGIGSTNIPKIATMNKVNNMYSEKNIFCKWTIIIGKDKKPILLNVTKSQDSSKKNDKYVISYMFGDHSKSTSVIDTNSYYLSSSIVRKITFMYYSPEAHYSEPPFLLRIDYDSSITIFDIVIIIVVVLLSIILLVILIIITYHCIKNWILKRNNRNNAIQVNRVQHNHTNEIYQKKIKNKMLLDELIKPIPYDPSYEQFGNVCTICFEEFDVGIPIIFLKCKHLFHETCLKDYFEKAILNPRCPNCNIDLIRINTDGSENLNLNQNNIPTGRVNGVPSDFGGNYQVNSNQVQNNTTLPNQILISSPMVVQINNGNLNSASNDEFERVIVNQVVNQVSH